MNSAIVNENSEKHINKIGKYRQIKEECDKSMKEFAENQKENILSQTAKMKELFLKEYEELIMEKNEEISKLGSHLNKAKKITKEKDFESEQLSNQVKQLNQELKEKDEKLKGK